MRLDAHQHFWRYDAVEYPWMKEGWPIRRDFLPPDLEPLLKSAGLGGCIAVQARQSVVETKWLLELADEYTFIAGVVGWVDLQSEKVADELAQFSTNPKLKGVRHVVQDEPDSNFMLRPAFLNGLGVLKQFNLTYDFLVFPHQLPAAIQVAQKFPEQRFVLDHIAKPAIRDGTLEPWVGQIRELAKSGNVTCKVSGMVTEANWNSWVPSDFAPYLDVVLEAFGPERLMYGSDWPVCLLAGEYPTVHKLALEFSRAMAKEQCDAFFGGNAAKAYRIA